MPNGVHHEHDLTLLARCHDEGSAAYEKCIARGGDEATCRAEEQATVATCLQGLVGCGKSSEWAYQFCKALGGSEAECRARADEAFEACLRLGDVRRRLAAHARQETLEKMLAEADSTARLWRQIFAKRETAGIFAKKIQEAFKEAGIKLDKGETFGCIVTAGKRPEYVSQLLPEAPAAGSRLFQVYAPDVMKAVMDAVEKDRITKP